MAGLDHQIRTDGMKSEFGCSEWLRCDRDIAKDEGLSPGHDWQFALSASVT
jgi:hypothetical protein